STYATPKAPMHVQDLVSLFDPAEFALMEAIPVAHRRFIDIAIRPAARIQRYLVRATSVTGKKRTVTRSGSCGRNECIPPHVFISGVCVQIKTATFVIDDSSHDPRSAQRSELSGRRIQGDVG